MNRFFLLHYVSFVSYLSLRRRRKTYNMLALLMSSFLLFNVAHSTCRSIHESDLISELDLAFRGETKDLAAYVRSAADDCFKRVAKIHLSNVSKNKDSLLA